MDKETEQRLAKLIMEEAAMLRRRADKEGVHVYLAKPSVRVRPNPQFLRATMRSVEQSNRIVEVNEMWRRRQAELEYDRKRRRHSDRDYDDRTRGSSSRGHESRGREYRDEEEENGGARDQSGDGDHGCTAGLRDEEVDQFLHSRVKRGRGAVGSRMDETGPYPVTSTSSEAAVRTKEDWENRLIGPTLPDKLAKEWSRKKQLADEEEDDEDDSPRRRKRDKKEHKKKKKEHKSSKKKKRKTSE